MGHIVVGIDGSESSRRALRWAMEEARLRGDDIEVVHAWTYPVTSFAYAGGGGAYLDIDWEAQARRFVDGELDQARQSDNGSEVPMSSMIVEGRPSEALIDRTKDADMIVVGSHGRGGFTGMLLGSVSQQVVQHAFCPVVVIRGA